MSHKGTIWGLLPLLGVLMLLGGCATLEYDDDWGYEDPIYSDRVYVRDSGYRNPDGLIVVYEPGLMLYRVVSYPDLYWNGGYYYRKHRSHWSRSRYHRGPWAPYRHAPPRVNVRHALPPGRPVPIPPGVYDRRPGRDSVSRPPSRAPWRPADDRGGVSAPRPPEPRSGVRAPIGAGPGFRSDRLQGRPRIPRGSPDQGPYPRIRVAPGDVNPAPEQGWTPWRSPGRAARNQGASPPERTDATAPGPRVRRSDGVSPGQLPRQPGQVPRAAPRLRRWAEPEEQPTDGGQSAVPAQTQAPGPGLPRLRGGFPGSGLPPNQ